MMKRILIIGASILQLPAINKAKEMGLYVGVVDYNPNAVGVSCADEYFEVSTIDEEGILRVAKEFNPDGIMTLATDMPMRSVAYATSKLGLVGISYDTAIKTTDKGEMIKAFEAAGVEHPWYYILQSPDEFIKIESEISFPCIIKPLDNAGSRGVVLVKKRSDLKEAIEYSSSNGRKGGVIIEEYLQGTEVSIEVLVIDKSVNILQVTDKLTTGEPHFVEMGHSQPSLLQDDDVERIKDLTIRAVKSVGINNGPAHVEIMLTKSGPKMIEIGARMGGDNITSHLVPLSTGIDMVRAVIEVALGMKPDIEAKFTRGAAIRYFKEQIGTIRKIEGVENLEQLDSIKDVFVLKKVGDSIKEIGSSVDRIGFVIAQADTAKEAIVVCEKALEEIQILVE